MSFNCCARIPHRAFLSVLGTHSTQFLHGILSTGPSIPPRGGFFTAFLHAQGRVLYDAFVYRHPTTDEGYLIEFDSRSSDAPPLLPLLKRYILRSKVKITDVSDQWDVWAGWRNSDEQCVDDRKWKWSRSGAVEPVWETDEEWPWNGVENRLFIRDRRAHAMGRRRVIEKGLKPPEFTNYDVVSSADYTLHRLERCVPEGIDDIPPLQAFPMESNLDMMGGLDFRKGCYVGQELTVRVYHTGIIRKRIYPVVIEHLNTEAGSTTPAGTTALKPGMDITVVQPGNSQGEVVRPRASGKLLTTMGNRGLALLRTEQVESPSRPPFVLIADRSIRLTPFRPSHWPVPEERVS